MASVLVRRADDQGNVRIPAHEVAKAGGFQVGDFVEFRVWPPAVDAYEFRRAALGVVPVFRRPTEDGRSAG